MKIIICGAGQVGYGIAERLAKEGVKKLLLVAPDPNDASPVRTAIDLGESLFGKTIITILRELDDPVRSLNRRKFR